MKKILMICGITLMFVANAHAWNWNIFGSDDHQRKHRHQSKQETLVTPVNVPEPMTAILLGVGLMGLAVSGIRRRK